MRATRILTDIAACLCDTITNSQVPGVCFCGVIPGDAPVAEYGGRCDDERQGMAWVRQALMYPASGINVVDESVQNCKTGIGMDIEIGMLRPAPQPDSRGRPPSPEAYIASAELMNDDAMVMLRALQCCDILDDLEYTLGPYTPTGPRGGVIGGRWALAVMI